VKKAIERPGRGAAKAMSVAKAPVGIDEAMLLRDLRTLVQSARQRIATVAYSTQTLLCWQLGRRLSFPDEAIVVTLSQQLSWSHFHALLPIKDPLARDFYAEMCRIERWDVRTLRQKIGGMLFQRTGGWLFEPAVLNSPKLLAAQREMHPQADQHQRLTGTAASCGHSGRTQSIEAAI
jgi:hypothetical protein